MKKLIITIIVALAATCIAFAVMAFRFEPRISPNTVVGVIPVGGLTKEEAAKKLRIWWESEKTSPIVLKSKLLGSKTLSFSLSELGLHLDDKASVEPIPLDDMWDRASTALTSGQTEVKKYEIVINVKDSVIPKLKDAIEAEVGGRRKAQVFFLNGEIKRIPEVSGFTLDEKTFTRLIPDAIMKNEAIEIPLTEAEKKVADADLDQITDVIYEFSTRFPARQISRNTNIKTAAGKINGTVLAPGERFSFNDTVGQRTLKNGFKIAGVYKNGKHDTGVGGGICQVSSTLYNAALFSNLKIVKRSNHSMPVAYLPVGRDATVDYGSIDMAFENSYPTPIAINSEFKTGRLTFRILGKKDPELSVKLETTGHKSWNPGLKTVVDKTLAEGKTKVIEKGSLGHSISTYRLVYKNGELVKRELLNRSYYKGGVRIVARGAKATTKAVTPPTPPTQ